jgi:hypothetical protein
MPKYRLPDEPRPGALASVVVAPQWPLLVSMLAGPWLGWPWFLINAHAVGSPSKWRQTLVVACGLAGSAILVVATMLAVEADRLHAGAGIRFALLGMVAWKLGISYWLFVGQARSVALFEYYRGVVRNGLPLVILGAFVGDRLLEGLPFVLRIVLQ